MKKYSLISFFVGISGSSLGFHNTNKINELLAVDCDPYVEKCFNLNFPEVKFLNKRLGDELTSDEILKCSNIEKGELDILFASPPCQGFSMAKGNRNLFDERNDLFLKTIEYINDIQPKVFIIENVKGLICGKMKLRFNQIIKKIESIPYVYKYNVLNASHYGVPQLRERIFIIGVRNDIKRSFKFPEPNIKELKNLSIHNYVSDIDFFTNGQFSRLKFNKNEICRTITATPSMKFYKNGISRKPKIIEIKRLCSFPEEYKLYSPKEGDDPKTRNEYFYNQKYKGLGNSVPPKLMEAVANKVITDIFDY